MFTRQPPLWFIDIALKVGAKLSISITVFQVFGMTRLWLELTTFRSGGEHSTTSRFVNIVCERMQVLLSIVMY